MMTTRKEIQQWKRGEVEKLWATIVDPAKLALEAANAKWETSASIEEGKLIRAEVKAADAALEAAKEEAVAAESKISEEYKAKIKAFKAGQSS